MTKPSTFVDAVPAIVVLAEKQYDWLHGGPGDVMDTDNGPVPSPAKLIADQGATIAAAGAEMIASPVVWQSRQRRCPEFSPPHSQPRSTIFSRT